MWLDLLMKLRDEFVKKDVAVMVGGVPPTHASITSDGVVILMRGEEETSGQDCRECYVTFYLETWIRSDSEVLEDGYTLLTEFEQKIENILGDLRDNVCSLEENDVFLNETWQLLDIFADRKMGDGDALRPLIGTQYTMKAKVYDVGNEMTVW